MSMTLPLVKLVWKRLWRREGALLLVATGASLLVVSSGKPGVVELAWLALPFVVALALLRGIRRESRDFSQGALALAADPGVEVWPELIVSLAGTAFALPFLWINTLAVATSLARLHGLGDVLLQVVAMVAAVATLLTVLTARVANPWVGLLVALGLPPALVLLQMGLALWTGRAEAELLGPLVWVGLGSATLLFSRRPASPA